MTKDTAFNRETTPRHTFPCSDSQCLPPFDHRTLCAKHGSPITGKSFIDNRSGIRLPPKETFIPFFGRFDLSYFAFFKTYFHFLTDLQYTSRLIIAALLSPFISKIISPQVSHGHPLILLTESLLKIAETTKFMSTVL